MGDFFQQWMSKEALKHPAFFLICIISSGIGTGMLFNPFVMADDFKTFQVNAQQRLGKLEAAVCTVQYSTDKNSLEYQIRSVSTEIFQLERLVASSEATHRDVKRLDTLKTDQKALERDLAVLMRASHCTPSP